MGYYINTPNNKQKAEQICRDVKMAKIVPEPLSYDCVAPSLGIICIVDNGPFEAAGFCYSEQEFEEFKREDGREKTWVLMPRKIAERLSGYKK